MKKYISVMAVILLLSVTIFAHGDKKHKTKQDEPVKPDTILIVGSDTISINGAPFASLKHDESEIHDEANEELHDDDDDGEVEEITLALAFEHLHNKIVHFPIALGIVLFIFMIVGYKQEVCFRASKIVVLLGLVFAIAAVFAGLNQAEAFEGKKMYEIVVIHRTFGFLVLANYLVMTWAIFSRQSTKVQLIISAVLALLISAAGFYGGIVSH